jgi:protein-S-isoprenylcysteine O-methyltransferase Ste14
VLVFAGPMWFLVPGRRAGPPPGPQPGGGTRAPLVANLAAVGLYVPSLLVFSSGPADASALVLAATGCLVAVAAVALVFRSRAELGSAWSLVPKANGGAGLVTTGPYRLVRHPIYLGLTLLGAGVAAAFGSWPACIIVGFGILPTFAWRARAEENLLGRAFGARYAVYRRQTRMIVPHLL